MNPFVMDTCYMLVPPQNVKENDDGIRITVQVQSCVLFLSQDFFLM